MIEQITVDERKAIVAYLDKNWNPVDKRSPDLVTLKVMFADGDQLFLGVQGRLQFD